MLITIYVPAFGIALNSGIDIKAKEKKQDVSVPSGTKENEKGKKNYYKSKIKGYDVFE